MILYHFFKMFPTKILQFSPKTLCKLKNQRFFCYQIQEHSNLKIFSFAIIQNSQYRHYSLHKRTYIVKVNLNSHKIVSHEKHKNEKKSLFCSDFIRKRVQRSVRGNVMRKGVLKALELRQLELLYNISERFRSKLVRKLLEKSRRWWSFKKLKPSPV